MQGLDAKQIDHLFIEHIKNVCLKSLKEDLKEDESEGKKMDEFTAMEAKVGNSIGMTGANFHPYWNMSRGFNYRDFQGIDAPDFVPMGCAINDTRPTDTHPFVYYCVHRGH